MGVSKYSIKTMLSYWTSDFTDQQIANIGSTFVEALECVVQRTATPVREIDLVSKDHVQKMQVFNAIDSKAIKSCVHDVIQNQIDA